MREAGQALLVVALLAYLQGALSYGLLLAGRRPRWGRLATGSLLAGLAAHSLGLLVLWLGAGQSPRWTGGDSLAIYTWLSVVAYVAVERSLGRKTLGALVTPLAAVALLVALSLPRQEHPALAPFLASLWLPVHVALSFGSYACLTVAFGSAALYLAQERQLKSRRLRRLALRLPPLAALELATYRLVEAGFLLLTLAIVVGAFGSGQAWGSYWSWEPKQTATLVAWLVYLAYFHVRNVAGWSGRQTARLAIAGFVVVVAGYLAVNLLLPGQHDFSLLLVRRS